MWWGITLVRASPSSQWAYYCAKASSPAPIKPQNIKTQTRLVSPPTTTDRQVPQVHKYECHRDVWNYRRCLLLSDGKPQGGNLRTSRVHFTHSPVVYLNRNPTEECWSECSWSAASGPVPLEASVRVHSEQQAHFEFTGCNYAQADTFLCACETITALTLVQYSGMLRFDNGMVHKKWQMCTGVHRFVSNWCSIVCTCMESS